MSKQEALREMLTCVQDGSVSIEDAQIVIEDILAPTEALMFDGEYLISLNTNVRDTHMLVWTIEPKAEGYLMIKGLTPYAPLIKLKEER